MTSIPPTGLNPLSEHVEPFWRRINSFFLFPLQLQPLVYSGILSVLSLLVFPLSAAIGLMWAALIVGIGVLLAICRYGFKVMLNTSRGILRASEYPHRSDTDLTSLPWKLFAVLLVQGVLLNWLAVVSPGLSALAGLVLGVLTPAAIMVLVLSGSVTEALNPLRLVETAAAVGWPYLLLCLFLMMLNGGMFMGLRFFAPDQDSFALALPLMCWVVVYFSWVMFCMMGYVLYQNHADFGIEPQANGRNGGERMTSEQQAE